MKEYKEYDYNDCLMVMVKDLAQQILADVRKHEFPIADLKQRVCDFENQWKNVGKT